jgi:hypothetical protein
MKIQKIYKKIGLIKLLVAIIGICLIVVSLYLAIINRRALVLGWTEDWGVTSWRNISRVGIRGGRLSVSSGAAGWQVTGVLNGQPYSETWQVTGWADQAIPGESATYSSGGFLGLDSHWDVHQLGVTGIYGAYFNDVVDQYYHPTAASIPTIWHVTGSSATQTWTEDWTITSWRNLSRVGLNGQKVYVSLGPASWQVTGNLNGTWQVTGWADISIVGEGTPYYNGGFLGLYDDLGLVSGIPQNPLGVTGLYGSYFADIADASYRPTAASIPTKWHVTGDFVPHHKPF